MPVPVTVLLLPTKALTSHTFQRIVSAGAVRSSEYRLFSRVHAMYLREHKTKDFTLKTSTSP